MVLAWGISFDEIVWEWQVKSLLSEAVNTRSLCEYLNLIGSAERVMRFTLKSSMTTPSRLKFRRLLR
jgi:hypothetical protein